MKIKQVLFTVLISGLTALGVLWGYGKWAKKNNAYAGQEKGVTPSNYRLAGLFGDDGTPAGPTADFTGPAQAGIPTVVHIKVKINAKQVNNNLPQKRQKSPFDEFFGGEDIFEQFFGRSNVIPEQKASGSGVIISEDGYIVTNNHVVENADEVTVTLSNKKSYTAKVVGGDPAYDLAVLKIEASKLPFMVYGNSDDVKIGQWVLALGYPLDLEATVTAGIVSAKARSIGMNAQKAGGYAVESYIQTDAAVNKGNSGGALINTEGKLIGINSAIYSPTGFYSGYSYAIPVNITKKVVDDLIRYGNVQRGYLGVRTANTGDIPEEERKAMGLNYKGDGLVITELQRESAAAEAGLKRGDIIRKINSNEISSSSELQEAVAKLKPGDKINIVYSREGKDATTTATLKNKSGNFDVVKEDNVLLKLGAELVTLEPRKAKEYGILGGVVVRKVKEGGAFSNQTRMKDNFIIFKVNGREVKSTDEIKAAIGNATTITVSGFYPGYDGVYDYEIELE